jgi:hypothetical protein
MKKTSLTIALAAVAVGAFGQSTATLPSNLNTQNEEMAGQLEEIAMCHHAIKAAHHDALWIGQNPYYRYVLYSPQGRGSNVYPIPARCKSLATDWILTYTKMSEKDKANLDKMISSEIGITISDMATDVQFLTVVIDKMLIEGEKATYWDNADKDIPKP